MSNPNPSPATRFPPGNNANPLGRPKGRSVTARLRDLLDQYELGGKQLPDGKQVADLIAEAILKGALKSDHFFMGMLMDRTEGKAGDSHAGDHGGGTDRPRIIPNEYDPRSRRPPGSPADPGDQMGSDAEGVDL